MYENYNEYSIENCKPTLCIVQSNCFADVDIWRQICYAFYRTFLPWHRQQTAQLHPFYTNRLETYCKPHHHLPSEYSSVHRTENDMSFQCIFPGKPQHM